MSSLFCSVHQTGLSVGLGSRDRKYPLKDWSLGFFPLNPIHFPRTESGKQPICSKCVFPRSFITNSVAKVLISSFYFFHFTICGHRSVCSFLNRKKPLSCVHLLYIRYWEFRFHKGKKRKKKKKEAAIKLTRIVSGMQEKTVVEQTSFHFHCISHPGSSFSSIFFQHLDAAAPQFEAFS